jgi:hypothetical protein
VIREYTKKPQQDFSKPFIIVSRPVGRVKEGPPRPTFEHFIIRKTCVIIIKWEIMDNNH